MAKNAQQRRKAKARAAAQANGTSYQQELEKLNPSGGGIPPGGGEPSYNRPEDRDFEQPAWRVPTVAVGVPLAELRLPIPDGLPRLGDPYIAEVVDDFGIGRYQIEAYDEDSDLTVFEDFGITVVRLGGWMPGRKARALVKSGGAALPEGDDGVDTGDGVPVEFANEFSIHSRQRVALVGTQEEPQGWEHSWEHDMAMNDPHPWKEGGSR
jgi:hypothetical protein